MVKHLCYTHIGGMTTRFRLRELLEEAGVSQSELARRTGLHFATINRLCTNATAQVSLNTLDRIATALGAHPGDLIASTGAVRRKR